MVYPRTDRDQEEREVQEVREDVKDQYSLDKKVGEGAYGKVWKAKARGTNALVALKRVRLDSDEDLPTTALREIAVLKLLEHDNIVRLKEVLHGKKNIYLVFEFVEMDLKNFMTQNPEAFRQPNNIKRVLYQILLAMRYIHERSVLHRDLKPQNVLVDAHSGNIKVADFGLARPITMPVRPYTHEVVTLWYRAPEILLNSKQYSVGVDMWSIGCIFAEMCNGGQPIFQGDNEVSQLIEIFKVLGTPTEETWPGVESINPSIHEFPQWSATDLREELKLDDAGWDLLSRMLRYSPSQRISSVDALTHEYFRGPHGECGECVDAC